MYDSLVTMEWAIAQGQLSQLHAVMVEIGATWVFETSLKDHISEGSQNMMLEGPG